MNILNHIWPWSTIRSLRLRVRVGDANRRAMSQFYKHLGKDVADERRDLLDEISAGKSRLSRIAAQETPNANATVKRMAKIARGEG